MVAGQPHIIEARIARQGIESLLLDGYGEAGPQGLPATLALTVRMRAPEGGGLIEAGSPETQWMDSVLGLQQDDFASWRWSVTPQRPGVTSFQIVASARAVGLGGLMAETALPDHTVDVRISANYRALAGRTALWLSVFVAAAFTGMLAEFALRILTHLMGR